MVSGEAPSRRTLCSFKKPSFASCMESVRPVWPPKPERMLSGFSFSMMRFDGGQRKRLDVNVVRHGVIRHDGRRVGVDEHDLDAVRFQSTARLSAGVVKFCRPTDDDRAGADDENLFNVFIQWHSCKQSFLYRSGVLFIFPSSQRIYQRERGIARPPQASGGTARKKRDFFIAHALARSGRLRC